MSKPNLVTVYAVRLVRREWRRFLLPLLSLGITAIVLSLTLLLTSASGTLLDTKAKELLGGDVILESTSPIPPEVLQGVFTTPPETISSQIAFTATIESDERALAVSMRVVDAKFPVYGEVKTSDGAYRTPGSEEIILDQASAEQLAVDVGSVVRFGGVPYTVRTILTGEPTSLLGSFRFFPRVLVSTEGFVRSMIDPALLRPEYEYAYKVQALTRAEKERLQALATDSNGRYQVRIAGENQGGLQAGLGLVRDFLVIAVLITAILATVNVYASTVYLITVERKSFAIMLSLGLTSRRLAGVLGLALAYIVLLATVCGTLVGKGMFWLVQAFVEQQFSLALPHPEYLLVQSFTAMFLCIIALSAFVPTLQHVLSLRPKQILAGDQGDTSDTHPKTLAVITGVTLLPLLFASMWLLGNVAQGVGTVVGVGVVYLGIAGIFSALLTALYKVRSRFPFWLRSILAQKRADGLFGVISFTSLFVALTALSTLVLLQVSLERYLTNDLSRTVPSTYVLDVQPSQRQELLSEFPEVTLFPNTPARIMMIDDLQVQDALTAGSDGVDRELGREFNITSRSELLASERLVAGKPWEGTPGEISVDEAFAKRAGITLGSRMVFSVQGFSVEGMVTSFRETDSRSGLPFFYFVLAPADLERFPVVYFGYAYQEGERQNVLSRTLASSMPNVTVLKTQALAPLILQISSLLLLVIVIVTIPPLLIAVLLVVTLIISSYSTRRLEGARVRALGATKNRVLVHYLLETSILTVSASVLAYLFGVGVAFGVSQYFFKLDSVVLFDAELLMSLCGIVALVCILGIYLFKTDTMKLRELLSYGDH
ncbi:MAG: FtsX-like permease family protein [Candidatus Pacebacteria bacterium]|nr:FtsX-like permease family protein [Candidatus Paceibacterota bacterium]